MPRTTQRVADLRLTVPADPARIHDVRDRFTGWMDEVAAEEPGLCEDLVVVVSELVANGIAAAPDDTHLVVHACLDGSEVVVEVSNPVAPWIDPAERWDLRDPLRGGGRGLLIVRSLVDDVEVVHDVVARETTVRCRRSTAGD